eukprot:10314513-Alexandrium_andersonii.AAC.1
MSASLVGSEMCIRDRCQSQVTAGEWALEAMRKQLADAEKELDELKAAAAQAEECKKRLYTKLREEQEGPEAVK